MISKIYLIYRCPYCHINVSRAGILRDHLEKIHTLKCNFTKERRRTQNDVTFVTEISENSLTRFGCCFCKIYYEDESVLKKHIENDHIVMTIIHNHKCRTFSYDIKNVNASITTTETEGKWILGDILVSDLLYSFRDQVIIRYDKDQPLSDIDLLALDYIFPFAKDVSGSTPVFTDDQHEAVIKDIESMQYLTKTNQFAINCCSDLVKMGTPNWRDVKLVTARYICTAGDTDNDDDLLIAEIIHALSGRLIRNSHGKRMLEDTFAHQYLDPILETIFGSDKRLKQDWANGALLPNSKSKRNNDSNGTENNDNYSNTEADENDKDVSENVYKPDWALFANGSPVVTVIGTLELKVAYKRNPGCVSDYVKLAKEMKLVLHQLIYLGIIQPIACGILIEGSKCETFIMDLSYNGIYRFIKLSKTDLCLSFQQLPLLPYFFEDMVRLRAFALETAQAVMESQINRNIGKEVKGKTPMSWLRKGTAKVERISLV